MKDHGARDFNALVETISGLHKELTARACKAININLTVRNWLIGYYISEYEMEGADRTEYGEKLFPELSKKLKNLNVAGTGKRQLYNYLDFYRAYPEILQTVSAQLKSGTSRNQPEIVRTASAHSLVPPDGLAERLSYSHLESLVGIDDHIKRMFYEMACIKGGWSVRELKRQIASLYYERSGLSKNKTALAARSKAETDSPTLTVRDPYVFEFLGLRPREVMGETEMEDSLLDKLQDFLLELGHGFCFEARQKRIIIGDDYFFVDLVFYHRILKCHVLLELKTDGFNHGYIGQLNTYVNWYLKNEMSDGDNPPIGILLCTQKNQALIEYALAGMDNQLFVSKYQLELPDKEDIKRFIEEQMRDR